MSSLAGLICVLVFLVGCASKPAIAPGETMPKELLMQYNDAARAAMSKSNPRSASGSRKPTNVALSAVMKYDRRHLHLFYQKLRKINEDRYHRYISGSEWYRKFQKMFIDYGVIPNRLYRYKSDDFLLPLQGDYDLADGSKDILYNMHERWWDESDLQHPRIQIVNNTNEFRGINYHTHALTLVDPRSLKLRAARLMLDEQAYIESVALHEAAHAIHGQMFNQNKYKAFKGKLNQINEVTKDRVTFYHRREVTEFLADAVSIQLGTWAIRGIATRIVRGGKRVGTLDKKNADSKAKYVAPHDASALFISSLIEEEQKRLGITEQHQKITWLRNTGNANANKQKGKSRNTRMPNLLWFGDKWQPFLESTMKPEVEQKIMDEYRLAMQEIVEILWQEK